MTTAQRIRFPKHGWTGAMLGLSILLAPGLAAPAMADEKPDFPKFEEVTKDMTVKEGFFTLYHDKDKDKLLARVPAGMLKEKFLWATSIASGPFAGYPLNTAAVYFERSNKKLVLIWADPRYKKGGGSGVADVIARTYTDPIIKAVPIVTETGGDPVIDLGDLFKTDIVGLASAFGGSLDRGLSRYGRIRNFEQNTNILVNAAFMHPSGGGQVVGMYYSLSKLPQDNGYVPREADLRLGYFLTVTKDWTTKHDADTTFKRHINRWRLRKAEPDQAVSDVLPEDQIVFYIEKTVPVRFRRYVRAGILEWNKAFEAAGLRNAVVVHQQTATRHADKDPEDVRYNFFRWIVTGMPFAMGPSRVNPFTGQILDADIIMDDSYVRYFDVAYDIFGPLAPDAYTDAPLEEFLAHHPRWDRQMENPTGYRHLAGGNTCGKDHDAHPHKALASALAKAWGHSPAVPLCEIGIGATRSLALASLAAAKAGHRRLPEEYVGQAIKETVMHEVGHTLGLRHNFKASSWLPLSDIKSIDADEDRPTTASVMDYNPYNFAETEETQGCFATPTLGPYDYWAIEYGYRNFMPPKNGEEGPANEQDMLKAIASRAAEPELDYATDEDTSALYPDPLVNRWDNGSDPVDFAREQMDTARRLWDDLLDLTVQDGQSYSKARKAFRWLAYQYAFGAQMAARIVGGQYIHRDYKGDPNAREPIELVPAEKQRAALRFLGDTVLSCKDFQFTPELLNSLAAGRWSHWGSDAMDWDLTFDIHNQIGGIHGRVLFQLLNPFTINRIYDAEAKSPPSEDALTVPELFATLSGAIWSELEEGPAGGQSATNRKPMITSFRRSLQRQHLQRLIDVVLSRPGYAINADCHAVARMALKDLGDRIAKTLATRGDRLDTYTKAHLLDSQRRAAAVLEAEFIAAGSRRR